MNWIIPEAAPLLAVFGWTFIGLCVVGGPIIVVWIIRNVRFK